MAEIWEIKKEFKEKGFYVWIILQMNLDIFVRTFDFSPVPENTKEIFEEILNKNDYSMENFKLDPISCIGIFSEKRKALYKRYARRKYGK